MATSGESKTRSSKRSLAASRTTSRPLDLRRLTVASSPGMPATTTSPTLGVWLAAHDDEVAVQDARLDHRVAADAQHEALVGPREPLREGEDLFEVLLGDEAGARRDVADQRHVADALGGDGRARRGLVADLERPGLGRVLHEEAPLGQPVDVVVHGGRGREAHGAPDLADRRRVAVVALELDDEVENLSALLGQDLGHGASLEANARSVSVPRAVSSDKHPFALGPRDPIGFGTAASVAGSGPTVGRLRGGSMGPRRAPQPAGRTSPTRSTRASTGRAVRAAGHGQDLRRAPRGGRPAGRASPGVHRGHDLRGRDGLLDADGVGPVRVARRRGACARGGATAPAAAGSCVDEADRAAGDVLALLLAVCDTDGSARFDHPATGEVLAPLDGLHRRDDDEPRAPRGAARRTARPLPRGDRDRRAASRRGRGCCPRTSATRRSRSPRPPRRGACRCGPSTPTRGSASPSSPSARRDSRSARRAARRSPTRSRSTTPSRGGERRARSPSCSPRGATGRACAAGASSPAPARRGRGLDRRRVAAPCACRSGAARTAGWCAPTSSCTPG